MPRQRTNYYRETYAFRECLARVKTGDGQRGSMPVLTSRWALPGQEAGKERLP